MKDKFTEKTKCSRLTEFCRTFSPYFACAMQAYMYVVVHHNLDLIVLPTFDHVIAHEHEASPPRSCAGVELEQKDQSLQRLIDHTVLPWQY